MEKKIKTNSQPAKSEGKKKAEDFIRLAEEMFTKQQNNVAGERQDFSRGYENCLINMSEQYKGYGYRFNYNGGSIIPLGGIVSVCGKEQLATQFLLIMTSVMMSGQPFGGLRRETPPASVLWIDTEHSPYEVQECMKRLYDLAGIREGTPNADMGLHILSLWDCNQNETMQYIQEAINDIDPDVIIIDGVSDFSLVFYGVVDGNDVTNWLLKNAKGGRNIFVAMHMNENNDKVGGYFGDVLKRKSSDIFTVSLKGWQCEVEHTDNLHSIPDFSFVVNGRGLPSPVPF